MLFEVCCWLREGAIEMRRVISVMPRKVVVSIEIIAAGKAEVDLALTLFSYRII